MNKLAPTEVALDQEALEEQLWDIDEEINFFIKDDIIRCTEYACDLFELPVFVPGEWVVRRWYLHCQDPTHIRSREARKRSEVKPDQEVTVGSKATGQDNMEKAEGGNYIAENLHLNGDLHESLVAGQMGREGRHPESDGRIVDIPQHPSTSSAVTSFETGPTLCVIGTQDSSAVKDIAFAISSHGSTAANAIVVEEWENLPYGMRDKPIVIPNGDDP